MKIPFTRYVYNSSGIKRNYSISKNNSDILLDCVLSRNPVTLKVELLRIAKESGSSRKPFLYRSENFSKIIAQVCVSSKKCEFDLAFEILECLDAAKPKSMILGVYELIDECIECGHTNDAIKAYMRLHNMGVKLDISGKERLLNTLALSCRLKELLLVLNHHSVTDNDLVVAAEPLIMSGNVTLFADLLNKYLHYKKSLSDPVQCSEKVARVIRGIMFARLRRFIDHSDPSFEENEGMSEIFTMLDSYHIRLSCNIYSTYTDVTKSPSHFHACQLYEMEKERMQISESNNSSYHGKMKLHLLPRFEPTDFPYVSESSGQSQIEPIHRLRIKDLTAELKRKDPARVLLYDQHLFPGAYESEKKYLRQHLRQWSLLKSLFQSVSNMVNQNGSFINNNRQNEQDFTNLDDKEEEEEEDEDDDELDDDDDDSSEDSASNSDDDDSVDDDSDEEGEADDKDYHMEQFTFTLDDGMDPEQKLLAEKMGRVGRSSSPPSFLVLDTTYVLPIDLIFDDDFFNHPYDCAGDTADSADQEIYSKPYLYGTKNKKEHPKGPECDFRECSPSNEKNTTKPLEEDLEKKPKSP